MVCIPCIVIPFLLWFYRVPGALHLPVFAPLFRRLWPKKPVQEPADAKKTVQEPADGIFTKKSARIGKKTD
uniref:CR032 protein n=1 Tax=Malurus cyaneus samueli TaxID=2593467 RepID=A0A8C5TWD3_9PASS